MRIVTYTLLLLFLSLELSAQNIGVEPYRTPMLPATSAQEAMIDGDTTLRYSIPIEGWNREIVGGKLSFSATFDTPFSWINRQSIIRVESASAPFTVEVGGQEVGQTISGVNPVEFNATSLLVPRSSQTIRITLEPDGASTQLDGWRGESTSKEWLGRVVVLSQPTLYIRDVDVLTTNKRDILSSMLSIVVKSEALNPRLSRISYELCTPQGRILTSANSDVELSMRGEDTLRLFAIVPDSLAWSSDNPQLFRLNASTQYRGRYDEYHSFRVGLRSIETTSDGVLLINGKPQSLKVAKVESSATISQLEALMAEGYNTLYITAGEYNPAIYNYADRVGLYIIATAPINTTHSGQTILRGDNPTNDPSRWEEYRARIESFYYATHLHPSIVAYAIAERSLNGYNLYEGYLLLKALEVQRPVVYFDGGGEWNSDVLLFETK